jgi:hypothetical protein
VLAQAPVNPPNKTDFTEKPPGNCAVSGRVVSAADSAPVRSPRVGLIQFHERKHPLVYRATTDEQGQFEIKYAAARTYEFFASDSGYREQYYKAGDKIVMTMAPY